MTLTHLMIIITIMIGISLLCFCFGLRKHKIELDPARKHKIKNRCTAYCLIGILCSMCMFGACVISMIGVMHGMYKTDTPLGEITNGIVNSPIEDKLPDDTDKLKGSIIIYYKFGCPDCEAVYKDLKEKTDNNKRIYWISTKSKQGENLLKKYPVEEVPAGIYIRKNDYNGALQYTQKILYKKQKGKSVFDLESFERLLTLQKGGK